MRGGVGARAMSPRRRRGLARLGILALLVVLIWSTQPNKRLGARRQRAQHTADLDASLKSEWDADHLPQACEAELAAVLPVDHNVSNPTLARSRLYGNFARGLDEQGLSVFGTNAGGATSQGLGLSALFDFSATSGRVTAKLERLTIPVRAIVIPLPARAPAAARMHQATVRVLGKEFPPSGGARGGGDAVWYQDASIYHFSVFHASHHLDPHTASRPEAQEEASGIRSIARVSCPIEAVIERVVVTPSGVVMALWNVRGGTEPSELREGLRRALPHAPKKQIVADDVILHTTLARLLRPPEGEADFGAEAARRATAALTASLCGVQATLPVLWFVHEHDKLALALRGKYTPHPMTLECKRM